MNSTNRQPVTRQWNYHPELPLKDASIFKWPPNPYALARWVGRNWLTLSERVLLLILATLLWFIAYPSVDTAKNFAPGWILQIWLVNLAMMIVIAGGLHWFFCIRRSQGTHLKFDHREQGRSNRLWKFSDQVRDNIFWSLTSGVFQLSAFQVVTMWMMANGYAPVIKFSDHPLWFMLAFVLLPIWSAFHFYFVHRLLHTRMLYKRVHSLHHRNVNIGPWSGISMHPIEHFLYFSTLCIHWVVPSHPVHLIFHVIYQGPGAAMTHTGYESLLIKNKASLALGTFYHQLHHRYYDCNYGNQEMPWDRWFGTFHDGTEQGTITMRHRRKRKNSKSV